MKVTIDAEACIGCGLCAQVSPDIFEMEGDKAIPKINDVPEDKIEEAKGTADQCPVNAINVG